MPLYIWPGWYILLNVSYFGRMRRKHPFVQEGMMPILAMVRADLKGFAMAKRVEHDFGIFVIRTNIDNMRHGQVYGDIYIRKNAPSFGV